MPVMVLLSGVVGCSTSDSNGNPGYAVNDAALGALTVSAGSLTPAFDSEIVSYAVTVARGATTFQVTPTARSPRAYGIQVKQGSGAFTLVPSGTPSQSYPAPAVGSSSTVTVRVIAEDQTSTKAYVVRVTQASADATLRALTLSQGSLAPAFASSTVAYTNAVPYGTASWTVTPTVNESHATVQVKQDAGAFAPVPSGSASAALTVPASGTSTVTVRVTAQDGTTQDYTITVSQAAPSTDATLATLAVSHASLSPPFAPGTTTGYTATVPNADDTFTVTPTVSESHATVRVKQDSGTFSPPVASGTPSGNLTSPPAGAGTTTVTVEVTAQDGTTKLDYTIVVARTASLSPDASLSSLDISPGSLTTTFSPGVYSYAAVLPYPTSTFTVTPTASGAQATIQVDQDGQGFGSASASLIAPPAGGAPTIITVRVTAQAGNTQDYTISVTQALPSNVATLDALAISSTTLNPAFSSAVTGYTAVLPYGTVSFNVTATPTEAHATIVVDHDGVALGGPSDSMTAPVPGTPTVVAVHVTAQDGIATTGYTITVSQLGPPVPVQALFPLYADTVAVTQGDIFADPTFAPSVAGMVSTGTVVAGYNVPNSWLPAPDPSGVVTVLQVNTGDGSWSGDKNLDWSTAPTTAPGTRWIQFAVRTSANSALTVNTISFYAGSWSSSNMTLKVKYNTTGVFTDDTTATTLLAWSCTGSTDQKVMHFLSASPNIAVNPGDTLYIRIYPWLNTSTAGTNKYLLLSNFKVQGTVQ
jgi:hypothetical protein